MERQKIRKMCACEQTLHLKLIKSLSFQMQIKLITELTTISFKQEKLSEEIDNQCLWELRKWS